MSKIVNKIYEQKLWTKFMNKNCEQKKLLEVSSVAENNRIIPAMDKLNN